MRAHVCYLPPHAFWRLPWGSRSGPFARHRYADTGTKAWSTEFDGVRKARKCERCGKTIWRRAT